MVNPTKVAEQAVNNNWLTIISRASMIVCAFSLPVIWGWADKVDTDRAAFKTAIQLLQQEAETRRDATIRNETSLLTMGSRISLLEIAGGRSDAQQQAVQDDVKEILDRIKRMEEALSRRGAIPEPNERADAG